MDLSQQEWSEKLNADDNSQILDVRTDEEVAEKQIPNAKQMDIQNPPKFMEELQQLDASKNYYVYCRSGARSAQACAILKSQGFENCYNLLGGITEWEGETVS
ncbi:MAG: rhodanese [Flavobacteriaceae bacterium]|jgi:rhodanese-related sulfurtransferase|nr:rhodanese [Flavobacteriaceae bacterium]|tara:strand:+ start:38754 stop:39062 length:309 start_codon:yes stop_codon:yes gene_type:complete